jgi:hypothetical protein
VLKTSHTAKIAHATSSPLTWVQLQLIAICRANVYLSLFVHPTFRRSTTHVSPGISAHARPREARYLSSTNTSSHHSISSWIQHSDARIFTIQATEECIHRCGFAR